MFFLCLLVVQSRVFTYHTKGYSHVLLTLWADENSQHTFKCCFWQIYPIAATKPTDQKAPLRYFILSESNSLTPGASTHFTSLRRFSVVYRWRAHPPPVKRNQDQWVVQLERRLQQEMGEKSRERHLSLPACHISSAVHWCITSHIVWILSGMACRGGGTCWSEPRIVF